MTSHRLDAKDDVPVWQTFSFMTFQAQIFTKMELILICGIRMEITVLHFNFGLHKT